MSNSLSPDKHRTVDVDDEENPNFTIVRNTEEEQYGDYENGEEEFGEAGEYGEEEMAYEENDADNDEGEEEYEYIEQIQEEPEEMEYSKPTNQKSFKAHSSRKGNF